MRQGIAGAGTGLVYCMQSDRRYVTGGGGLSVTCILE